MLKDPDKIIETCRLIAPSFGGINLEDISALASLLQDRKAARSGNTGFHDDQHGTAIVLLAGHKISPINRKGRDTHAL